ncbi:hypothetical protein FGO68_gene15294 [Halteria grandinella]|uniref:Uncharacterized protein n=1 Tax=Halteria grandinella TaxID=5974 RepID=A0A8J8NXK5_HALGN|nr:hypothetical protein FGO68_gene15294 [Halteria grandinella]
MLKGQMLQRISELELSASIDIKDSQKRVDHQFLEVSENIRKLRDFMLQIKESARITEVPYAKKTETEETYKRLEKRIDMLTDTVMRNSIGPLQEVMMKQPIKNNSHNQSANGQISSENINEQNSQHQGEPVTVTEHEDRSPARFSPMSGRAVEIEQHYSRALTPASLGPPPQPPSLTLQRRLSRLPSCARLQERPQQKWLSAEKNDRKERKFECCQANAQIEPQGATHIDTDGTTIDFQAKGRTCAGCLPTRHISAALHRGARHQGQQKRQSQQAH